MSKLMVLSVLGASCLGLGLFKMKHLVEKEERKLKETTQEVARLKESLHVLKAEWTYLNEPQRLEKLNGKHLKYEPLETTQIISWEVFPFSVPLKEEGKKAP